MRFYDRREWLRFTALGLTGGLACRFISADEKLKDIACRSVHLGYPKAEGTAFYNTCRPVTSARGTYFCVCGWDAGYYGIQELGNGDKVLLFSIWDSDKNDPNAAPEAERVKTEFVDPRVRVKRFGGEGSGGQSFFPLKWELDQTYRFIVSMTHATAGRVFQLAVRAGYEEVDEARHLFGASQRTVLRGLYSFVEDFQRNRTSTMFTRRAQFGPAATVWAMEHGPPWSGPLHWRCQPVVNIDSRIVESRFELATGGSITNEHNPLNQIMTLPEDVMTIVPDDLPQDLSWKELSVVRTTPLDR